MTDRLAPRHLSAESRRLWRATLGTYELEPRHVTILTVVLEALDRLRQVQVAIAAEGLTVEGRFGIKSHPANQIERDARIAFIRAQRELGLDLETPTSRPPTRWK